MKAIVYIHADLIVRCMQHGNVTFIFMIKPRMAFGLWPFLRAFNFIFFSHKILNKLLDRRSSVVRYRSMIKINKVFFMNETEIFSFSLA